MLYHFPKRYEFSTSAKLIQDVIEGESVTLYGRISGLKTGKSFRTKVSKAEGKLNDDTGSLKLIWFHQPYIAKLIQNESLVKVHGKISERNGEFSMLNPEIESISAIPVGIGDQLFKDEDGVTFGQTPVYAESKGVTSKWFFHAIQKIFKHPEFQHIEDPIPEHILKSYNLPSLTTALI